MPDGALPSLVAAVRRFAEHEVDALGNDRKCAFPPRVLEQARELDLFALSIPERWGGLGLSLGETAAIVAELARTDRSLAVTVGLHNGLGTRALVERGSDAQKKEWLPLLARGECIAAFAATEPHAGSDLTAMRTIAHRERSKLRIDGEKSYVTNGALAGLTTVLVRMPDEGARATALLLVPRGSTGLVVGPEERKMGLRASSTCALHFDTVMISDSLRIGAAGTGIEHAHRALEWGRSLMAAGCLGTARAALERTVTHARERRQFGRPLIELGAVRSHVAAIAAATATIESVLLTTAEADAAEESIATRSAALKVLASELAFDACDRAIQVHGAMGFIEDAGVAILARDCRVTRIFEGANDVLLLRLGTALLAGKGLPRHVTGGPGTERLASLDEALARATADVRRAYGVSAIQRQPLVLWLARADAALFAAAACLHVERRAGRARERLLRHAAERSLDVAARALAESGTARAIETAENEVVDALPDDLRSQETLA